MDKKSQINHDMIPDNRPLPERVHQMFKKEFEPQMVKAFGPKEKWDESLKKYWEMSKLAALQASMGKVEFYNESNEKDDL